MALKDIKIALKTVGVPVSHYEAKTKPDKYIVWAEDGPGGAAHADDALIEQALSGTVDYFTKMEYDPNVKAIQNALNDAEISYRINSIQKEEDTGYIHYEWVFEVDDGQSDV